MKKRYLLLMSMLMVSSLYSSLNIKNNKYNNLPSPSEIDKIYKLYIDKKYPRKVKSWKAKAKAKRYKNTYWDKSTKLMWQDEPYTSKEKYARSKNNNLGKVGNWKYAKNYCNNLSLAKYHDWYLPNLNQLNDLYEKKYSLKHITSSYYWSSSSYASNSSVAWGVNFNNGLTYNYDKPNSDYVRCVRGRQ